jgi:uncharacterized protein with ParB-like and HNH nuclease domain
MLYPVFQGKYVWDNDIIHIVAHFQIGRAFDPTGLLKANRQVFPFFPQSVCRQYELRRQC